MFLASLLFCDVSLRENQSATLVLFVSFLPVFSRYSPPCKLTRPISHLFPESVLFIRLPVPACENLFLSYEAIVVPSSLMLSYETSHGPMYQNASLQLVRYFGFSLIMVSSVCINTNGFFCTFAPLLLGGSSGQAMQVKPEFYGLGGSLSCFIMKNR